MTQTHSSASNFAAGGMHRKEVFQHTWKALSGQLFNHLLRADWLTAAAFVERVARGAGSQTSMVSAISAITTLAKTKSSSCLKLSPRLFSSASIFMVRPMPSSIASLTGKPGSPSNLSLHPIFNSQAAWNDRTYADFACWVFQKSDVPEEASKHTSKA